MAATFKYRLGLGELSSKKDRLLNCLLAEFVGECSSHTLIVVVAGRQRNNLVRVANVAELWANKIIKILSHIFPARMLCPKIHLSRCYRYQ